MEHLSKSLINWASILDHQTAEQATLAATMPFIHPHIALMPDAHLGKGATVGSVIPTLGAIIPAAVGVDIGCGMIAVRTQFTKVDTDKADLSALRRGIEAHVPTSAGQYNKTLTETAMDRTDALEHLAFKSMSKEDQPDSIAPNWRLQLGTLGSGNHFIEISLDEQDRVWAFLHSGSRGIGNRLAMRHIKSAQRYCEKNWIQLPHPDLAYLVEGTDEFNDYKGALYWAQEFALENRNEMMDRVLAQLSLAMGEDVDKVERINCHHNYTSRETHFGKSVWLSRKGAIEASEGTPGLIPGSMGAASYVVTGLGNPVSLNSAPHGAGRVHSRSAARKQFTQGDLRERMAGIEYRDTDAFIDEHPDAYKNIDVVMEDAKDLVAIRHTLRQIVNVKGD